MNGTATLRRALALVCAAGLAAGAGTASATKRTIVAASPMAQLGQRYGHSFDLPAPPAGQTPEQRARWIAEKRPALGRAPMEWCGGVVRRSGSTPPAPPVRRVI